MSRSLQQQAEQFAGRKPDGDPAVMEANAAKLRQMSLDLGQLAERMGKTHMSLEGPVIERANDRAAKRQTHLGNRAKQLDELAKQLTSYASSLRSDLNDWNNRVQRELTRLNGAAK